MSMLSQLNLGNREI